ncbi:O-methyltransferase [Nonlabens ponticola]|uniref:O-methyltransferase n=1 Tax=Nonlabens ponticola TaxID=2496866 RepID=UPI0013E02546|nr:class I SAM-dependent methyltransferase [Nonlabens ponticola]
MWHQIKYYLAHRFKSIHLHGIHSPFIYAFNKDCLQQGSSLAVKDELLRFRESITSHPATLQITDHGAGSKKLNKSLRNTSQILKVNCSSHYRTQLLARIADYLNVENALELGTSLGVTAHALSLTSDITTVEASPAVLDYARQRWDDFKISNITSISSTFDVFLDKLDQKSQYDLVFIDGHHDGAATLDYFERLLPHLHDDSIVIVDDIYWSTGMTTAWKTLQNHPKVTACIDTFQWGLIFLRKEQRQQTFHVHV